MSKLCIICFHRTDEEQGCTECEGEKEIKSFNDEKEVDVEPMEM